MKYSSCPLGVIVSVDFHCILFNRANRRAGNHRCTRLGHGLCLERCQQEEACPASDASQPAQASVQQAPFASAGKVSAAHMNVLALPLKSSLDDRQEDGP